MAFEKKIPQGRVSRLARLGKLAGGVAGGMIAEGARRLARGEAMPARELLLTPANAQRVSDELAKLRGAAMKVGQLISMDAGNLIPPELADILARLRSDAHTMPMSELVSLLEQRWGSGWEDQFEQFSFTPLAAASIGQVHRARTKDGRNLALKIQYPGVKNSIDSDVDNVISLLKLSRLLPAEMEIDPLLNEAKRQLHLEADYRAEAENLMMYHDWLADDSQFAVPEFVSELSCEQILAMEYMAGEEIERLVSADRHKREEVVTRLLQLFFREFFALHAVQTDPNFANFLYDPASTRIVLLDFGAVRKFPPEVVDGYRLIFEAAMTGQEELIEKGAEQIGYFSQAILPEQKQLVLNLFKMALEPLCAEGGYDFATSDLATRMRDTGLKLSFEKSYWHSPPVDALFLHRKLAGLFLLAVRLRVTIDCRGIALAAFREQGLQYGITNLHT